MVFPITGSITNWNRARITECPIFYSAILISLMVSVASGVKAHHEGLPPRLALVFSGHSVSIATAFFSPGLI